MGIISKDKNKITLIYNSNTFLGSQTLSYVSASEKKLLAIDTSKTDIPGTQWSEIADGLDLSISDLVQKELPNYKALYDPKAKLDQQDWLKIIQKHPEVVGLPIIIIEGSFYQMNTPSEFLKFIQSDSAGISRNPDKNK
ncbi:Arsenate reductase, glutaredoxin family [Aquimarina amphilecti]|uniref:Arsenate reductase, glutaredoxin family n=1 Tax=Aquimarina amphilecti TaxID=1038014 RepID=A0A1H7UFK6_AQUAM|nr:hypothetical protein [Aquimarina amphilecti]SEL95599.1 Arsenate reductase, glutaredoxin family [Aquimarina amphilecti]